MASLPVWDGWPVCVEAFTDGHADELGESRGNSAEFFLYLKTRSLIGIYKHAKHGECIAFPVHDGRCRLIACHYRYQSPDWTGEGSARKGGKVVKRWAWGYEPSGRGTHPLIIGDPKKSKRVWVFESQWDAFAILDQLRVHELEKDFEDEFSVFITRGASNGGLARHIAKSTLKVTFWPQNDPVDERTGKAPSEQWIRKLVEEVGQIPAARVQTPREYEDAAAWVKARKPDAREIIAAVEEAQPARESKLPPFEDAAFMILPANLPKEPEQVIRGFLHKGSKLVLGGSSKSRKSFSLLDLALSVATGAEWWGIPTRKGRVAYLNFELQRFDVFRRIQNIQSAKGTAAQPGDLRIMTLRGNMEPIESLAEKLIQDLLSLPPFSLIVVDPIYKLLGERDENNAGHIAALMAQLEHITVRTDAAIAFGAHSSKGNQSGKDSIDRIGGSGVFARDPDAIITMTAHEQEDSLTVEATLRNFAPVVPFVISWGYPLFTRDSSGLDPADLKQPRGSKKTAVFGALAGERANSRLGPALDMLVAVWKGTSRAHRYSDILRLACERCRNVDNNAPLPEQTARAYFRVLRTREYIAKDSATSSWVPTSVGDAYIDEQTDDDPDCSTRKADDC